MNTKKTNTNTESLAAMRNEFINTISRIAKGKLTADNMIVFNEPLYLSDDTYYNDDCVDALIVGDNDVEIIALNGDEEVNDLAGLTTGTLAKIADLMENGEFEIEG